MANFIFSTLANTLTKRSGYYIDWSRVGELLVSGKHRYSWQQLVPRGFILASMAAGAYSGYKYTTGNEQPLNTGLYSMAGCFVGFVISHAFVIAPLLYKRYQMSQQCMSSQQHIVALLKEIEELGPTYHTLIEPISRLVNSTLTLSASNEKQANASQTWGKRRRLMESIAERLAFDVEQLREASKSQDVLTEIKAFWIDSPEKVYAALPLAENSSTAETQRTHQSLVSHR